MVAALLFVALLAISLAAALCFGTRGQRIIALMAVACIVMMWTVWPNTTKPKPYHRSVATVPNTELPAPYTDVPKYCLRALLETAQQWHDRCAQWGR
jgi:hypothetical protein